MTFFDPGAIPTGLQAGNITCGISSYLFSGSTQIEIPASWSNDIGPDGLTGDWVDHAVGVQASIPYRGVIKFPLDTVPQGTISSVELVIETTSAQGNGSETYKIGPYADNGLGDPSLDSGIFRWASAGIVLNPFILTDIAQRTIGPELWNLGNTAITLVQNAIDADAASFSIALNQTSEVGTDNYTAFAGYLSATPPRLRLVYSAGKVKTCGIVASLIGHKTKVTDLRGSLRVGRTMSMGIASGIVEEGGSIATTTRTCVIRGALSTTGLPPTLVINTKTCGMGSSLIRIGLWLEEQPADGVELIIER